MHETLCQPPVFKDPRKPLCPGLEESRRRKAKMAGSSCGSGLQRESGDAQAEDGRGRAAGSAPRAPKAQ